MEIRNACEALGRDPGFINHCKADLALGEKVLPGGYQPKITFIAVQKRHKVRVFVKNPGDGVGKVHAILFIDVPIYLKPINICPNCCSNQFQSFRLVGLSLLGFANEMSFFLLGNGHGLLCNVISKKLDCNLLGGHTFIIENWTI